MENQEVPRELTITRIYDAPRRLVWKAWTDPKILQKWWGPRGVTNPTCEWNAKKGGQIYIVMLAGKELGPAAGAKWPMKGTFTEVKPESRLAWVGGAMDDLDRSSDTFLDQEVTLDLEEMGDKTKLTLHIVVKAIKGPKAAGALRGMSMGFNQQMDKLGEELQKINGK